MLSSSRQQYLLDKSQATRIETLRLHQRSSETRISSSLSPIEIFVSLYYGKILNYNARNPFDENRDRFIISKGHGSISMYPILADLGFFDQSELKKICQENALLGSIPDPIIPGYETINGSLGHGLGVSCGISLALKTKKKPQNVVVLTGDGELNEGANWEAIMFAQQHKLDNLTLIIDYNKVSMLDFSANIIDLDSLSDKFKAFNWQVFSIADGHNIEAVHGQIQKAIKARNKQPKVVIAHTIKGKGVASLEIDSLSHIAALKPETIDQLILDLQNAELKNG